MQASVALYQSCAQSAKSTADTSLFTLITLVAMQHYQPLEMLSPALFGSVQKWQHTPSGEYVAIKRIELHSAARKRCISSERDIEEDLITEIKINMHVQLLGGHPNVLPLLDCIIDKDAVLLILKFCKRGELLNVLNAQRVSGKQLNVQHIFTQILRGATFLHASGIAHRDLSLENVLVDERDCCYITDFGLATQSAESIVVKPVGKRRYMAPEVYAAMAYEEEHDVFYNPMAADVWALGVMLYAMVACRYPFREPIRKDNRFRLLEDFGVEYLLEKDEVAMTGKEPLVNLLKKFLVVDPGERPSLAELEFKTTHSCVQVCETRPVSPVDES
ncbi:putative protein kinase [Plasmopara halstedii]